MKLLTLSRWKIVYVFKFPKQASLQARKDWFSIFKKYTGKLSLRHRKTSKPYFRMKRKSLTVAELNKVHGRLDRFLFLPFTRWRNSYSIPLSFSLLYILSFSRLMESFGRCCSLSWHRIRSSVPSRKRRYSTPYWHKIVTKRKVRFICTTKTGEKEIKPKKEMQTQNQPTTQQEMGKRKFLDASYAKDNQSWLLFSLEFGFAFSTTDKRWKKKKNRANIYGRSSVFLALDWTAFATGDKTIKRQPKQERK